MMKKVLNLLTTLIMTISLAGVLPASTASADYWGVWGYNILNDGTVEITDFFDDSVTSLDIPATLNGYTVTSIGTGWLKSSGFASENLTSITIPDGVTSIGDWAFYECRSLTSITIPNSVTSIGNEAFLSCYSLTSVTIPDSVTSIGNDAFLYSGLSSVKIGNGVTYIGEDAFGYCRKLTSVLMGNSLEIIENDAFLCCESLKSITIPDSVTSIGDSAFESCDSLASVTIGNNVTSIGYEAFSGCESLSSIIIPENVTSIGYSAFENCSGLTSVIMPKNITSIGESTFSGCTNKNLKIFLLGEITDIGYGAFSGVVGKVYVCDTSIIDALPSTVTPILLNDYGDCGDDAMWFLDSNGVMTILGQGSMNDYLNDNSNTASWYDYNEDITSVVIEKNITNIGDYAFYKCVNLTNVTIPNSVTVIGDSAFKDCYALTSVTIPKSVTSIGNMAFGFTWDSIIQEDVKVSNFKIYCYKGTAGEQYAIENGFEVAYLDPPTTSSTTAKPTTTATKANASTKSNKTTATKKAKVKKVTKPGKVKIKIVTYNTTPKIKIKWKKVKSATGYQVKYTAITYGGKRKTWKVLTKKKSYKFMLDNYIDNNYNDYNYYRDDYREDFYLYVIKKYVVKVRAYKKVNGKKYFGKWSKAKKLTIGI